MPPRTKKEGAKDLEASRWEAADGCQRRLELVERLEVQQLIYRAIRFISQSGRLPPQWIQCDERAGEISGVAVGGHGITDRQGKTVFCELL